MNNNWKEYKNRGGLLFAIYSLPRILLFRIAIRLSSFKWRFFIGEIGRNVTIYPGVHISHPKNVKIGDNVIIGKKCEFSTELPEGYLKIGDNVQINTGCSIDFSGGIEIEENCLISSSVKIYSHSHGYNPRSIPKPIPKRIEADSWIGAYSIIGQNVKIIKRRTIIGFSSVVVKSINEERTVLGGNPARVITKYEI